jgi:hypothetical protein
MEKIIKKLFISFVTITWILCSAALCIADDFCTSSLRLDSGSVSIKSVKDEVLSSCENAATKSVKSDSPEKRSYKYGSTDYISEELITTEQEDQGY